MASSAPLCSWFLAACISRTVLGSSCDEPNKLCGKRRRGGKLSGFSNTLSSYLLCKEHAEMGGHFVALCGSGIHGLGSCFNLESCSGYGFQRFGSICRNTLQEKRNFALSAMAARAALDLLKESNSKEKKTTIRKRRVVVTGMGVATPLGHDPDSFYNNLLEGKSGISEIENFNCKDYPTRIAGEIKAFSTDGWVVPKLSKRLDKFMLYMLMAGKKALVDGGMTEEILDSLNKYKCGVLIGSALGGMKVFNDAIEALRISYRKMNPFCIPFATTNMGSAILAMDLGWMGPNYSISTACATSNFCIINAANHIIRGEADVMLCGGSDAAIIPIGLGGFVACGALSQRNEDPTKASRPWDMDRDGFVMGEGAGVLLLEELEHARVRGAEIYAEFLGGSMTCDAYHVTEPHPEGTGVLLCIEKALHEAGLNKEDVNYVNAHASSTKSGDLEEYKALIQCFYHNPELKINSTKSMIGHLLGAAGAVEAVATIQAIRRGWLHPTINLDNPEKDLNMNVIVGAKKERLDVKVAMSNSFGFGGHNSSLLFAPFDVSRTP